MRSAFYKTDNDLAKQTFDSTYSGTTCVSVILSVPRLLCANVGDSRAVLASRDTRTEGWSVRALSRDHKPNSEGEMERILGKGGRVFPYRGENGEELGPHRVWHSTENIPGLAMSRSIGDRIAIDLGVIPDPEVEDIVLTPLDKFIVIASDGVWEFMSNEEVKFP